MKNSLIRLSAWKKLDGKWGSIACVYLVFTLLTGASGPFLFVFVGLLLSAPLLCGMYAVCLRVARRQSFDIDTLFSRFNDFTRSILLDLSNTCLILVWSLLFIVPGIIKSLSYSMSYFIMLDDPQISPNEARKKSMEMMRGHKGKLFCLQLSFIGWILLSIITFGILLIWIGPYMQTAQAEFYLYLKNEKKINFDLKALYENRTTNDAVLNSNNEMFYENRTTNDAVLNSNNEIFYEKRKSQIDLFYLYEAGIITEEEYKQEIQK